MKVIKNFFGYIIETTQLGFYYICLVFSKGFFFYFYLLFAIIEKIIRLPFIKKIKDFFKNKQGDPVAFLMLVLFFFLGVFLYTYLYADSSDIKYVDDGILQNDDKKEEPKSIASDKETYSSKEVNLYRKYGGMDINSVNFNELKNTNSDVVAWLMVDGTNINYPIVKTSNNDYYLNHDIVKNPKASGWTFMDYRNDVNMNDDNTIFYGHNLLNKTSFGSISNIFTKDWFNNSNHYIVVRTPIKKYVYEVFSIYYIDPEVYYLQSEFYSDSEYKEFLDKLKSRSKYKFSANVSISDKIITLSTCTDDNKGRKVVHAKLIDG